MATNVKPEDKHFKHSNGVLLASAKSAQRQGSGKKTGAPAKTSVGKS
jgi:hypothetical protein